MPERPIGSVLKTEVGKSTVGSNPTPSALPRRIAREGVGTILDNDEEVGPPPSPPSLPSCHEQ
jgi:hypothetical protein